MPFIIMTMAICIIVAAFALQNSLMVPVKFIFFEQEASLVLVILISAFLGLLIGMTVIMYMKFKNYLDSRKKNEKIKNLTDENILLEQKIVALEKRLGNLNVKPNEVNATAEAPTIDQTLVVQENNQT